MLSRLTRTATDGGARLRPRLRVGHHRSGRRDEHALAAPADAVRWPPPGTIVSMSAEVRVETAPEAADRAEHAGKPDGRLLGIDVARAVAQLGMLITHYSYFDGTGGDLRGRDPLLQRQGHAAVRVPRWPRLHDADPPCRPPGRSGAGPRLVVLVVIGLLLVEHAPLPRRDPAVLRPVLRRWRCWSGACRGVWLLVLAGVTTLVGGWSWLHLAPDRVRYGGWQGWETVTDPRPLLIDLLVSGSYPALPTFAFFLVGMWVGRQALGRRQVQVLLVGAGLALALAGFVGGEIVDPRDDRPSGATEAIALDRRRRPADRIDDRVERRGDVPPATRCGSSSANGNGPPARRRWPVWPIPSVTARCRPGSSGRRDGRWPSSG